MKKELIEKLEAAESVEEINAVKAEIEAEKSREEAIAEKAAILDSFKAEEPEDAPKEAKSLGEFAVKNLDLSAMRSGASKSAGTGFLFKAATDVHAAPSIAEVSRNVVDFRNMFGLRDLFGSERISGNALTYFQMGATEAVSGGAPKTVAQGATKPQFHVPYTAVTEPLQKVAGWFYETDELLADAAFLASTVENRGLFELAKANEAYLGGKLLATSGIQTATYASTLSADDVFAAMMGVKSATGYDADAIMINPVDYQALRLAKDSNLQYYGGGYFYAPYGNGQIAEQPGIWGLKTYVTTAVASGTVIVGAFRAAASVFEKDGEGAAIEIHRGDHDDAINNRVTVVVENRLGLAVRVPSAFVKISKAS